MNLVWRKGGGDTGFVDIAFDPFGVTIGIEGSRPDKSKRRGGRGGR